MAKIYQAAANGPTGPLLFAEAASGREAEATPTSFINNTVSEAPLGNSLLIHDGSGSLKGVPPLQDCTVSQFKFVLHRIRNTTQQPLQYVARPTGSNSSAASSRETSFEVTNEGGNIATNNAESNIWSSSSYDDRRFLRRKRPPRRQRQVSDQEQQAYSPSSRQSQTATVVSKNVYVYFSPLYL